MHVRVRWWGDTQRREGERDTKGREVAREGDSQGEGGGEILKEGRDGILKEGKDGVRERGIDGRKGEIYNTLSVAMICTSGRELY